VRTLDLGFKAHLESGATTLATCWRLARRDGVVLGFTDHDLPLSFAGTDYLPATGLAGGEVGARTGPAVDTAEVIGVLSSDAIGENDIAIGRYDGATVETWRVNWRDTGQRLLLGRATIGEIVREDGRYRAELRSGQQALNQVRGRVYSPLCDATLGDARCGIALGDAAFTASATVTAVLDRNRIAVDGLGGFAAGWFSYGRAAWTSGPRAGLSDGIASHRRDGSADILGFVRPGGGWVAAGDTLTASAGCDRQFATCRDRFANVANFRGFPHIPGNDFVLRYPAGDDVLDGGALVR
jgi:uncharacterized phage protein (TIGR02218 family)